MSERLLDTLLERAYAALPADMRAETVVFGSAPMVFAGLKPDVQFDLDLFVDEANYRKLLAAGFVEDRDERGMPRVMIAPEVEVVKEWPAVTFADVLAAATPKAGSRSLPVAALEHVLAFKRISSRPKDQAEAGVIDKHLQR